MTFSTVSEKEGRSNPGAGLGVGAGAGTGAGVGVGAGDICLAQLTRKRTPTKKITRMK